MRLVSHTTASPQTPGFSGFLAMSADGRYVAFDSPAPDVVPGQVNLARAATSSSTTGSPTRPPW